MEAVWDNPVLQVIADRASIRAYTREPLSPAQMEALKRAALAAPTAVNAQTQRFLFVTNPALLHEVEQAVLQKILASGDEAAIARTAARGNKVLYDAPLLVIVTIDPQNAYTKIDAGIAAQTLALAAKSMGLDSVIVGMPGMAFSGPEGPALKQKLRFPAGLEYGIGVLIGHRAMDKAPHTSPASHILEIS